MAIHSEAAQESFDELVKQLGELSKKASPKETKAILMSGATMMKNDANRLPYPISKIRSAGYSHMVNTFQAEESSHHDTEIEVGWGKYYGPMVEHGTRLQHEQAHLIPLWNRNKERYFNAMAEAFNK